MYTVLGIKYENLNDAITHLHPGCVLRGIKYEEVNYVIDKLKTRIVDFNYSLYGDELRMVIFGTIQKN
jgi:hypothetical protein